MSKIKLLNTVFIFILMFLSPFSFAAEPTAKVTDKVATDKEGAPTGSAKSADDAKPTAPPKPHVLLIPERMERSALAGEVDDTEVVWLDQPAIGKAPATKFLGLMQKIRSSTPQGAVILLHDIEQSPDWPGIINPLRLSLPDDGWFTLSIALSYSRLPTSPDRTLPTKTVDSIVKSSGVDSGGAATDAGAKEGAASADATEKTNDTKTADAPKADTPKEGASTDISKPSPVDGSAIDLSEDSTTPKTEAEKLGAAPATGEVLPEKPPWREETLVRVINAISYIRNKGYENRIIIGVGKGAQGVFDYVKSQKGQLGVKGFAVVLVNPKLTKEDLVGFDDAFGKNFALPVLDIYSRENKTQKREAKLRKGAALRAHFRDFTSASVAMDLFRDSSGGVIQKRIRNWLLVHAPGMKTQLVPAP